MKCGVCSLYQSNASFKAIFFSEQERLTADFAQGCGDLHEGHAAGECGECREEARVAKTKFSLTVYRRSRALDWLTTERLTVVSGQCCADLHETEGTREWANGVKEKNKRLRKLVNHPFLLHAISPCTRSICVVHVHPALSPTGRPPLLCRQTNGMESR